MRGAHGVSGIKRGDVVAPRIGDQNTRRERVVADGHRTVTDRGRPDHRHSGSEGDVVGESVSDHHEVGSWVEGNRLWSIETRTRNRSNQSPSLNDVHLVLGKVRDIDLVVLRIERSPGRRIGRGERHLPHSSGVEYDQAGQRREIRRMMHRIVGRKPPERPWWAARATSGRGDSPESVREAPFDATWVRP